MSNTTWDAFGYIGIAICVAYILIFAYEACKLFMKKKHYVLTEVKARKCELYKKWAYTLVEVKYDFKADGSLVKGICDVKSVLRPAVKEGSTVHVYYNPDNCKENFLEEQMKCDAKNALILLVVAVIVGLTLFI